MKQEETVDSQLRDFKKFRVHAIRHRRKVSEDVSCMSLSFRRASLCKDAVLGLGWNEHYLNNEPTPLEIIQQRSILVIILLGMCVHGNGFHTEGLLYRRRRRMPVIEPRGLCILREYHECIGSSPQGCIFRRWPRKDGQLLRRPEARSSLATRRSSFAI
jgi:hypothetical protein